MGRPTPLPRLRGRPARRTSSPRSATARRRRGGDRPQGCAGAPPDTASRAKATIRAQQLDAIDVFPTRCRDRSGSGGHDATTVRSPAGAPAGRNLTSLQVAGRLPDAGSAEGSGDPGRRPSPVRRPGRGRPSRSRRPLCHAPARTRAGHSAARREPAASGHRWLHGPLGGAPCTVGLRATASASGPRRPTDTRPAGRRIPVGALPGQPHMHRSAVIPPPGRRGASARALIRRQRP